MTPAAGPTRTTGAGHASGTTGIKRVLVVDDDEAIRVLLSEVLQTAGVSVVCAPDGAAALAFLRFGLCRPPDAIILDLAMPNLDGVAFAHRYHATAGRHVPLVVLSAIAGRDEAAERTGAVAVLGKPFDVDQLLEVVRLTLNGRWSALRPFRAGQEARHLTALAQGWRSLTAA